MVLEYSMEEKIHPRFTMDDGCKATEPSPLVGVLTTCLDSFSSQPQEFPDECAKAVLLTNLLKGNNTFVHAFVGKPPPGAARAARCYHFLR
jgi:hypothetical protein